MTNLLRTALLPLADRITLAIVFGSFARQAANAKSDLDLLILSDDLRTKDLASAIRKIGSKMNREVNLNLYQRGEWKQRLAAGHPLATSIRENPRLVIFGDENELG